MPNYLGHERFWLLGCLFILYVTVTTQARSNIFSKQYHYFSCFESGVSKRRLLRGKLCVSYSVIFKLVEFHLLCDNQMAAMLFWLAFISLLPQGRCPGYISVFVYVYVCVFSVFRRHAIFTVDAILQEKDRLRRLPVFQSLDESLSN